MREETGLKVVAEPYVAFEVEIDDRARLPTGPHRAVTYRCEAAGKLQPNDPDGLVCRAVWVEMPEAVHRLSEVGWYDCEPLRRYLSLSR